MLQSKDQDVEVEFMVVTRAGELVCMDVAATAGAMVQVLQHIEPS